MFMCFLFFKQKTAYEVRIRDWSADVCSSDLLSLLETGPRHFRPPRLLGPLMLSLKEWEIVALSLKVGGVAVLATLPIAFGLAWILARYRFPGRVVLDADRKSVL